MSVNGKKKKRLKNVLISTGNHMLPSAQVVGVAASETIKIFTGLGGGIRLVIHVWLTCLDTMECGRLQGCHIKADN